MSENFHRFYSYKHSIRVRILTNRNCSVFLIVTIRIFFVFYFISNTIFYWDIINGFKNLIFCCLSLVALVSLPFLTRYEMDGFHVTCCLRNFVAIQTIFSVVTCKHCNPSICPMGGNGGTCYLISPEHFTF